MFQVTVAPLNRSGSSPSDSVRLRPVTAAISAKRARPRLPVLQIQIRHAAAVDPVGLMRRVQRDQRLGSRNGNGRMATVSTTLKIVLFTPIPSARQAMVSAAKPGFLTSVRTA